MFLKNVVVTESDFLLSTTFIVWYYGEAKYFVAEVWAHVVML